MQQPIIKKKSINLLWIIPIIALGIGLWLAYQHVRNTGAMITIDFRTGEGIAANKTKIRYKNLDIGTVTNIGFSEDLSHVTVEAQMIANASPLLNQDTKLWVVKPQITAAGITGLSTIISGSYIALEPGNSNVKKRHFKALEQAPAIPLTEEGQLIKLQSADSAGLNLGSPVYYRGLKVGQITEINYQSESDRIYINAFVRSPYDKLIDTSTKFWNISGIKFDVGTNGANIEMESVESLLLGGITFSTPTTYNTKHSTAISDKLFTLYGSESATIQPPSFDKKYYVIYFDDSIRGLDTSAPVELNGIKVGQVIDIRLLYDEEQQKAVIPVLIEVEPQRIDRINKQGEEDNLFTDLVGNGLRASMETDSLITGSKFIKLSMYPDDPGAFTEDQYSPYLVMPSRSTGISRITDGVSEIIDKVKNLPIDRIADEISDVLVESKGAVGGVSRILNAPKVDELGTQVVETLDEFNETMKSISSVADNAAGTLQTVNSKLNKLIEQLEETMYGLSPNSSLYFTLQETLTALRKTADSVEKVATKLDEKPNALLFGN